MSAEEEAGFGWLPAELARRILERLSPIENCMLSQVNRWWRTTCSSNDVWRDFCKSRFQLNDITTNGFKKLAWTYPGAMSTWKDWFAFRSQFRREVAGSIEVEVLEVVVGTGDKVKRIPAKNLTTDFSCLSQPLQAVNGVRASVKFHFDEYHTLIQGEIYENRSWFYTRSSLGNFSFPVFHAKKRATQVWIDLDEPNDYQEADYGSQADSECAVLSDDENNFVSFKSQEHLASSSAATSPSNNRNDRQVHYGVFSEMDDATTLEDEHDFDVKSDHSTEALETHPRGRRRSRISAGGGSASSSGIGARNGENGKKSRSVPTSPKRGRTSSIKSSTANLASSSSNVYLDSGAHSPLSPANSQMNLSRPSSPTYTSSGIASPTSDPASPRESYSMLSNSKHAMKASGDAVGWFPFLSTSPPLPSSAASTSSFAANTSTEPTALKRQVKRVLLQLTMTPVMSSVQDFEIVASISHGALNSPNELFLVKDKDLGQPRFMKIVPIIPLHDDDAPPIWEGCKESVAYSTTLTVPMPIHPFLVEQITSFQTDNKLYLMMEWLGGGELFSVLRRTRHGRFDEHEALFYTAQLVLGLEHMHSQKVIYRDLKPENLLLSAEGHLKITQRTPPEAHWNGGATKEFSIVTAHSMPEYLAPEILKGLPYTHKVDSWSVGAILYHMLVGQPPFQEANVQHLFAAICGEEVNYPNFLSADVTLLLKGLLHRDVKKRLSLKQVRQAEWFDGLDWARMLRREYSPPLKPFRRQDLNFAPAQPAINRRRTPQRGALNENNALPAAAPAPGPRRREEAQLNNEVI